jgi:hypothetical protein
MIYIFIYCKQTINYTITNMENLMHMAGETYIIIEIKNRDESFTKDSVGTTL